MAFFDQTLAEGRSPSCEGPHPSSPGGPDLASLKCALQLQWERCEPWLAAALARDARNIPLAIVRSDTMAGKYHLLPGASSAILAEIIRINGWRHLNIYLAGGEMAELLSVLLPRIESWAAYHGCHSTIVMGRKGWVRALRQFGYSFLCRNGLGDWIVAKELKAETFKDRTRPMTAVNYSIEADYIALTTDTLVTDCRDWWPAFMMPKANFIPHLDGMITCTSLLDVMRNAYNFALSAPVSDVESLAAKLPAICRQSLKETMALCQHSHPPTEDFSWVDTCALSLFGWSPARRRLVGLRLSLVTNFEPELLPDGVYAMPAMPCTPTRITKANVMELRQLTIRQQEQEIRKTPADRNAIGGDILLWEMEANGSSDIASRVRRVHRFSTYGEDQRVIAAKSAA